MARVLRTRRPHSPPRYDVLRSTVVLRSTDRAHQGATICFAGAGLLGASQLCTWVQPDSGTAHQDSGDSTSRFLVPRGTGQLRKEQDKDRNVNKGDEEDVCNTMTKSRTSRWSNTTHEEQRDANANDDHEDEDTPPMRFSS